MVASIALIDGTGVVDAGDYDNEMRNGYDNTNNRCINKTSFINKIYDLCNNRAGDGSVRIAAQYFRGPGQAGPAQSGRTCASILEDVKAWYKSNPEFAKGPIFAAGYSRGGYIAIEYAKWLGEQGLNVKSLFLFDAVERDCSVDIARESKTPYKEAMWYVAPSAALAERISQFFHNSPIPGNVQIAYHAVRDPSVYSRWYFDNCGLDGVVVIEKFKATHAAMGGIPWTGDHPVVPQFDLKQGLKAGWEAVKSGQVLLPLGMQMTAGKVAANSVKLVPTTTEKQDFEASDKVWAWMSNKLKIYQVI